MAWIVIYNQTSSNRYISDAAVVLSRSWAAAQDTAQQVIDGLTRGYFINVAIVDPATPGLDPVAAAAMATAIANNGTTPSAPPPSPFVAQTYVSASAPADPTKYPLWFDITFNTYKRWDKAKSAWVSQTIGSFTSVDGGTAQIQFRRDTAVNWQAQNPVLGDGEPGYEHDTGKVKFGDGSSHWNDLPYGAGGSSSVSIDGNGLLTVNGASYDLVTTAELNTALAAKANTSALAPVATSGAYSDLTGKPVLAPVATSGLYSDLGGKPAFATVATSGAYSDLTGKPVGAALVQATAPSSPADKQLWYDTTNEILKRWDSASSSWKSDGSGTYLPQADALTTYGRLPKTTDRVLYVSKNGNDTNDGLSWGGALLTVAAALTALGANAGTIEIGAGTFTESNLTPNGNQTLRGRGRYATTLQLASSGTLIALTNQNNACLEHLGLSFASSAVTGTLVSLNNTFTCHFVDCRLVGTNTAGQVGVQFSSNAGDSYFDKCHLVSLDVGAQIDSTVNYFTNCVVSGCNTGMQGGDSTGAARTSGVVVTDTVFRGTSNYYVNILGTAQQWHLKGCWFDSHATTAVQVGTGTYGPWLFSMSDIPYLAGSSKSLVLNAADWVDLKGIVFGNNGSNPTDLSVTAANCPRGSLGAYKSTQGTNIENIVPNGWKGAVGYATSGDNTVSLVESYSYLGVPSYGPLVYKRIVIRIVNRTTSTAGVTLNFPTPFTTTFGGGQFFKTFDNTSLGMTFTASGITVPANVACASGLIVIEGF